MSGFGTNFLAAGGRIVALTLSLETKMVQIGQYKPNAMHLNTKSPKVMSIDF
jgi:hypothetical protein